MRFQDMAKSFCAAALLSLAAGCGGSEGGMADCDSQGAVDVQDDRCVCRTGYAGNLCDVCATGWERGDDGACHADCGRHGAASSEGDGACACDEGYAGILCRACAAGWQDNDGDGTCDKDCASAGLDCEGGCSDASGTAACVPVPEPEVADWTFMVFLNGDNDLGYTETDFSPYGYDVVVTTDYAAADLTEMLDGLKSAAAKSAGRPLGKLNVVVLFDESKDSPDPSTRVYQLTADRGIQRLDTGKEIFSKDEADMSSANTLKKFGVWVAKNFPARHYAMDLWDHGGSWKDVGEGGLARRGHCDSDLMKELAAPRLLDGAPARFSLDETDGVSSDGSYHTITYTDGAFGKAMAAIVQQAGKKLDLVSFDACSLAQVEIIAAVAPYADYLVASTDTVSGLGFSYDDVLEALSLDTGITAKELGTVMADSYCDRTEAMDQTKLHTNATMGVFDLAAIPALATALSDFGDALTPVVADAGQKAVLDEALDAVWRIPDCQTQSELWDVAHQVKERSDALPSAVSTAADALMDAVIRAVAHYAIHSEPLHWGYSHDGTHGITVFLPLDASCQYYKNDPQYSAYYSVPAYADLLTYTLWPCVYSPAVPDSSSMFTRADVKDYVKASKTWGEGWGRFLQAYLGL